MYHWRRRKRVGCRTISLLQSELSTSQKECQDARQQLEALDGALEEEISRLRVELERAELTIANLHEVKKEMAFHYENKMDDFDEVLK